MFVIFVLFVIFSLFTKQNSCHIERYKLIEFASKIIFIIFILPHLKIYFHSFLVIISNNYSNIYLYRSQITSYASIPSVGKNSHNYHKLYKIIISMLL